MTDSAQVKSMVETCKREFGAVDILQQINLRYGRTGGSHQEDWDKVNAVNVKSMFLTCKHAIPEMEAQGKGAIVNISSIWDPLDDCLIFPVQRPKPLSSS